MTETKTTKKIEEVLPINNGLIFSVNTIKHLDFSNVYDLSLMDEDYILNSGLKTCSRYITKHINEEGQLDMAKLAALVANRFAEKWNKLWVGVSAEYNILENYSMEETSKDQRDNKNTSKETIVSTGTYSDQDDITDNDTIHSNEQTEQNGHITVSDNSKIFGFDSQVGADDSSNTSVTTDTSIPTTTRNETNNKTYQSVKSGESGNNETRDGNVSIVDVLNHTLVRRGNVGVTTSSEMQEQYLEIVQKWFDFCKLIYEDLDTILTLKIYE